MGALVLMVEWALEQLVIRLELIMWQIQDPLKLDALATLADRLDDIRVRAFIRSQHVWRLQHRACPNA